MTRDRWVIGAGIAGISGLAWLYTLYLANDMEMGMMLSAEQAWTGGTLLLLFGMWIVMMLAMMAPSATPMIITFATIQRNQSPQRSPLVASTIFFVGYLLVWTGFSAVAVLAQWGSHDLAFLARPDLGGALLLIVAGVFQWTPLKQACLSHCRTPLYFLMTNWREGWDGALGMGLKHGVYCLGCCAWLMTILLVVGAMNLLWMALLATLVLVEKVTPRGVALSRLAGLVLIAVGAWHVINSLS